MQESHICTDMYPCFQGAICTINYKLGLEKQPSVTCTLKCPVCFPLRFSFILFLLSLLPHLADHLPATYEIVQQLNDEDSYNFRLSQMLIFFLCSLTSLERQNLRQEKRLPGQSLMPLQVALQNRSGQFDISYFAFYHIGGLFSQFYFSFIFYNSFYHYLFMLIVDSWLNKVAFLLYVIC